MPISVTCPQCQAPYRLADEMAGKKLKCQKCQGAIVVPAADDAPASSTKLKSGTANSSPKKPAPAKKNADPFETPDDTPPKKAKKGGCSGLMIGLLLFLGVGLLGCLGCGGYVGWWFYDTAEKAKADLKAMAVADKVSEGKKADKAAKDKKKTDPGKEKEVALLDGKKDGPAKDGQTVDVKKDKPAADGKKEKTPPPIEVKKEDPVKEKKDVPFVPPPVPPGVIGITLGPDGTYRSDNVLTDKDPTNQEGKPHKAYQIIMEAGQTYQIDMVSNDFDSYLFLRDGKNNKITEDDDSGGIPHARIIYRAEATGAFRIQAAHFDKKTGKYTLTVKRTDGKPVAVNPDNPPPQPGKIDYKVFNFGNEAVLVGDLVWARDGQSFYALDKRGILMRVKIADGTIDKQNNLGAVADGLCMSGAGLLVTLAKNQEVWVVDPDDLTAIKKKIAQPGLTRIAAGVDAKVAIVEGLHLLDLQKGAYINFYKVKDSPHRCFQATRDGRFVFAAQNDATLKRFRVDAGKSVLEETSQPLGDKGNDVCISPDGQFVCVPGVKPGMTLIFAANDLKRPAYTIANDFKPTAVGLDPLAGFVYSHDAENAVVIHTFAGVKRAETKIRGFRGIDVKEVAVAPGGAEYLLRGVNDACHIKLDFKGEPIGKGVPK